MTLTNAARELHELNIKLAAHIEAAKKEKARLREEIRQRHVILNISSSGIDVDKVELAKTILSIHGSYAGAGSDRASVISDAIKQLATGLPPRPVYGDLWRVSFGTKSYDRWHGQRTDCDYGCGPRHGHMIFEVGLHKDVRTNRTHADLTPEEIEAAIYYLTNLERVHAAEDEAKAKAAA